MLGFPAERIESLGWRTVLDGCEAGLSDLCESVRWRPVLVGFLRSGWRVAELSDACDVLLGKPSFDFDFDFFLSGEILGWVGVSLSLVLLSLLAL